MREKYDFFQLNLEGLACRALSPEHWIFLLLNFEKRKKISEKLNLSFKKFFRLKLKKNHEKNFP